MAFKSVGEILATTGIVDEAMQNAAPMTATDLGTQMHKRIMDAHASGLSKNDAIAQVEAALGNLK